MGRLCPRAGEARDTLQSRQPYNKQRAHRACPADSELSTALSRAPLPSPGGTQRPAGQCPVTAPQLGGRDTSPQRQERCTLQQLFPRQWCPGPSVLHLGVKGLSKIFIPSLFSTTVSTAACLAHVSIAAAIVLTHHSHCSTLLLGDWAKQEAPSEMVFFASEQTFPSLASSCWSSLGWRVQPSPATTSISVPGQARRKPSSPRLRQTSDTTKLKICIFQTKVQSPNGKRIQEKCSRPGWWPASSMSTSLRRNPARSLD